jgi:hypothetical protein
MHRSTQVALLLAALHCASPAPPPPAARPAAAIAPEATTPAVASTCPPGTSRVAVAPCPARTIAEALHCGARDCKAGTVWDGTKCTAECAPLAAEN